LLDIFAIREPRFVFEGDTTLKDRHLMQYSFNVAEAQSHFRAKAGDHWVISGYTGTVLVDPVNAKLVQLTIRTEELPPATNACEVDATLEYGMVRLRGDDYLIPAITRQRFIGMAGRAAIHFRTDNADRRRDGRRGRSFHGKIGECSARQQGKTSGPAHAAVEGRVVRIEIGRTVASNVVLIIRLTAIEIGGATIPLAAGRKGGPLGVTKAGMAIDLPLAWERNSGIFRLPGENGVMPAGLRTDWVTAASDAAPGSK
jgi:hypothetical protein